MDKHNYVNLTEFKDYYHAKKKKIQYNTNPLCVLMLPEWKALVKLGYVFSHITSKGTLVLKNTNKMKQHRTYYIYESGLIRCQYFYHSITILKSPDHTEWIVHNYINAFKELASKRK